MAYHPDLTVRFFSHVVKDGDCWVWTGCQHKFGYGRFRTPAATVYAHRWAYELWHGPVPAGKYVLHSCDNPPCVNPDHLRAGSQAENFQEAVDKGRFDYAARKMPVGEQHHAAKLTEADVRAIRAAAGSQRQIGVMYGISQAAVHNIRARKTWQHVL